MLNLYQIKSLAPISSQQEILKEKEPMSSVTLQGSSQSYTDNLEDNSLV